MLAVERWAKKQNPIIAYFAMMVAVIARDQCGALQHIKERRIFNHQFPLPHLPSWFGLYLSIRPLLVYKRLISSTSEFTDDQLDQMSDFRKMNKALKLDPNLLKGFMPSPQEMTKSLGYWSSMCSKLLAEINDDINNNTLINELQDKFSVPIDNHNIALSFYFLVFAPCHILYKTSPSKLYNKALTGDLVAIGNLLRLDPLILHDPAIGYQIQSVRLWGG